MPSPSCVGTGEVHAFLPRRPVVDGRDARIAFHAHVPDARRAVGVARGAAEHAAPEHVPLTILERALHVAFITAFANQCGHDRAFSRRRREF